MYNFHQTPNENRKQIMRFGKADDEHIDAAIFHSCRHSRDKCDDVRFWFPLCSLNLLTGANNRRSYLLYLWSKRLDCGRSVCVVCEYSICLLRNPYFSFHILVIFLLLYIKFVHLSRAQSVLRLFVICVVGTNFTLPIY